MARSLVRSLEELYTDAERRWRVMHEVGQRERSEDLRRAIRGACTIANAHGIEIWSPVL